MVNSKKKKMNLILKSKFKSIGLLVLISALLLALSGGCVNKTVSRPSSNNKVKTNDTKIQPVVTSNDKLRMVFEDNAREAIKNIIPEMETFAQSSRNATSINTIMLEDESWKENENWNRFTEGYYLSFKKILKEEFGKRFIEPYSSFDDQSASKQMGKMHKINPDEFRPGDILIRISSMVDSTGFNFFVKAKKYNSALEIANFHIPKDYEDEIRITAKEWKDMEPLFDKPAYPGSMEMPFTSLDKTAEFLSKVICSSFPEIQENYGDISNKRIMIALTKTSSASLELSNEFTKLMSGKLKGYCPEINQTLTTDGQIQSIQQAIAKFQSGLFHQSEDNNGNQGSLGLQIPNILLWVNMDKTMDANIYHVSIDAVWLDKATRGEMINEFYAEAYFQNENFFSKVNLQKNNKGVSGIWIETASNGKNTKNIVVTGVEIKKQYPSLGTDVWLPDKNSPYPGHTIDVYKRTDLMQILMKKSIKGQGIVRIRYHIENFPEKEHTAELIYSE